MNSTLFPDNNMVRGNNVDKLQQEPNVSKYTYERTNVNS